VAFFSDVGSRGRALDAFSAADALVGHGARVGLLARRGDILTLWLAEVSPKGAQAMAEGLGDVLTATWQATLNEPGGIWILRALRAVPQLAHVRAEAYAEMTEIMASAFAASLNHPPRDDLWLRVRVALEFAFSADELLFEETRLPPEVIIAEATDLLRRALVEPMRKAATA
jgi:hypothetical protein